MNICQRILDGNTLDPKHIQMRAPIALAYVGDTIFDLYLRTQLVSRTDLPPKELHQHASRYANAAAQAAMIKNIEHMLTEEEHAVFRRGRNAKSYTVPKHAKLMDYRYATGFEALLGYIYLSGHEERLVELIKAAVSSIGEEFTIHE